MRQVWRDEPCDCPVPSQGQGPVSGLWQSRPQWEVSQRTELSLGLWPTAAVVCLMLGATPPLKSCGTSQKTGEVCGDDEGGNGSSGNSPRAPVQEYFNIDLTAKLAEETRSARSHNINVEEIMAMFSALKMKSPNATIYASCHRRSGRSRTVRWITWTRWRQSDRRLWSGLRSIMVEKRGPWSDRRQPSAINDELAMVYALLDTQRDPGVHTSRHTKRSWCTHFSTHKAIPHLWAKTPVRSSELRSSVPLFACIDALIWMDQNDRSKFYEVIFIGCGLPSFELS